jgi:hypothetical protein
VESATAKFEAAIKAASKTIFLHITSYLLEKQKTN